MSKSYYLFQASQLSRKQNTIQISIIAEEKEPPKLEKERPPPNAPQEEDEIKNHNELKKTKKRYLPVEQVEDIYVLSSIRLNSALLNFLGKNNIAVHFFDYYEHYTGSFLPKEKYLSGKVAIEQVRAYSNPKHRLRLAKSFIQSAAFNMRRNVLYYQRKGIDLEGRQKSILRLSEKIDESKNIPHLMGIEGNIRQHYYACFDEILKSAKWLGRKKRPATDPVNALISFGNSLLYAKIVSQIYHTQLLSMVSFLHEPAERRFSLALDISEVFKPILVDRLVFRMFNKNELTEKDFHQVESAWFLKNKAKKKFLKSWEDLLATTIQHKTLKKKVSYGRLVRLEMYKLIKDILLIEEYKPFKMWW